MRLGSRRYKALQIPIQNDILHVHWRFRMNFALFSFQNEYVKTKKRQKKKQENQTIITNKYE